MERGRRIARTLIAWPMMIACASMSAACGPSVIFALQAAPSTQPAALLEVTTTQSGVADPIRLSRCARRIAFAGLAAALTRDIEAASRSWAELHTGPDGLRLHVELTQAEARRRGGQIVVTLGARATLRTRVGNRYLAQTQVHCTQSELAAPSDAAPVFYRCMTSLSRDLAGWLGGVPL